jgi:predicted nucleic acid-binding protein
MRVYVETNFLLEIVLLQEQHQSCEEIVRSCENGSTSLTLPAFSIPEAYFALVGKGRRRDRFAQEFEDQRAELTRSSRFKDHTDTLTAVQGLLIESIQRELQEFYVSLNKALAWAEMIPLSAETLRSAASLVAAIGLQLPDAIVLASVLAHLDACSPEESCFLNRDRDFGDPYIFEELTKRSCKMLFSFEDGANYLCSLKLA